MKHIAEIIPLQCFVEYLIENCIHMVKVLLWNVSKVVTFNKYTFFKISAVEIPETFVFDLDVDLLEWSVEVLVSITDKLYASVIQLETFGVDTTLWGLIKLTEGCIFLCPILSSYPSTNQYDTHTSVSFLLNE